MVPGEAITSHAESVVHELLQLVVFVVVGTVGTAVALILPAIILVLLRRHERRTWELNYRNTHLLVNHALDLEIQQVKERGKDARS